MQVEVTLETMPSGLFDALVVPNGNAAAKTLSGLGHALEFIKEQYRHAKPIWALGDGCDVVAKAGVPATLPSGKPDPGLLFVRDESPAKSLPAFIKAVARHRHHEREMDPPAV